MLNQNSYVYTPGFYVGKCIKRFAFIEEKLDDKIDKVTRNELKRLWELAKKD